MSSDAIQMKFAGREYTVEPPFTNRELHLIKQISGVRAGEMFAAMDAGDNDVLVALAHLAVLRAGTPRPSLDELWDLPAGEIELVVPDENESDPTVAPDGADDTTNGSPGTTPEPSGAPSTAITST